MNFDFLPVYIGYDSREDIAYKVCEFSIYKNTPDAIVKPLKQDQLRRDGLYTRDVDSLGSTEFTFTRFLVPSLQKYKGWALFCDCDFVWDGNISELFAQADPKYAVMVVQHNHQPTNTVKMDNKQQAQYPRKNWSSMILWNCEHPSNRALTPEVVNSQTGQFLHRFQWLQDHEIGSVSTKYNFLVGWNDETKDGKPVAYHWTEGGPWFPHYMDCLYKNVWYQYLIDYANELGLEFGSKPRPPLTFVTSLSRDYFNEVGSITLASWRNTLPGDVVFVWDDKPVDLGFGKNFMFWKDVANTQDPWVQEAMGGTKADRFWKKSRVQVWAARKFGGLVVWLDADISVKRPLSFSKAKELLSPGARVCATLIPGTGLDLETGIVAFNTKHEAFPAFIREYSTGWYNGQIYQQRQIYDNHMLGSLIGKYGIGSYCDTADKWQLNGADERKNEFSIKYSPLNEYFHHHIGILNKELLIKNTNK